jgi:uncharacterized membrane protein YedE/YeeE
MIGAIGVHFLARRLILRRSRPIAAQSFDEPKRKEIDAPLVVGAAMFGVGWGMSGVCPGPALVSLGSGSVSGVVFAVAMACGMWLHGAVRPTLGELEVEGAELMRGKRHTSRAQTDG